MEWLIHKDSFMLIIVLFFLWSAVSLAGLQFMTLDNLKLHTGKITDAEIIITRIKKGVLFKDTTRQMRIYLDGNSDFFVLPGKNNYAQYDSLFIDDSVNVYTKEMTLGIFGFNPRFVYHMVREGDQKVFVNISKQKGEKSGLWLFAAAATIVFALWYLGKTIRRMQ